MDLFGVGVSQMSKILTATGWQLGQREEGHEELQERH
jgi:hypothetical protein